VDPQSGEEVLLISPEPLGQVLCKQRNTLDYARMCVCAFAVNTWSLVAKFRITFNRTVRSCGLI
jgi:hypothetical protein